MSYDVHNLVKWAQLSVLSVAMALLLFVAMLMDSTCAILLSAFGLLLLAGMKGFHFMWFAVSNFRRSIK